MDYFAELKTPAELFSEFTDYLESRLPSMESDLGVEFDVIEGGDYPMAINESNHSATATITYCGIEIGSVVVSDCLNKESFSDSPISWLFLPFEKFLRARYFAGFHKRAWNKWRLRNTEGTPLFHESSEKGFGKKLL